MAAIRLAAPGPACKAGAPTERPLLLNIDDDFRLTQLFAEMLILAMELLVRFVERAALGLGATLLLWCHGVQDSHRLLAGRLWIGCLTALLPIDLGVTEDTSRQRVS
jgi:hypothetical protein